METESGGRDCWSVQDSEIDDEIEISHAVKAVRQLPYVVTTKPRLKFTPQPSLAIRLYLRRESVKNEDMKESMEPTTEETRAWY